MLGLGGGDLGRGLLESVLVDLLETAQLPGPPVRLLREGLRRRLPSGGGRERCAGAVASALLTVR